MSTYRPEIDPVSGERFLRVKARGTAITQDSMLNKGTAFDAAERDALELGGLLPPSASSMEQQLRRVYENYCRAPDDLARYLYLVSLQDRNETLFYRLVHEHIEEMAPIIYTPTVGEACRRYSHIYRRSRGLYVTEADLPAMGQVLHNAPFDDVKVIVATDSRDLVPGVPSLPAVATHQPRRSRTRCSSNTATSSSSVKEPSRSPSDVGNARRCVRVAR